MAPFGFPFPPPRIAVIVAFGWTIAGADGWEVFRIGITFEKCWNNLFKKNKAKKLMALYHHYFAVRITFLLPILKALKINVSWDLIAVCVARNIGSVVQRRVWKNKEYISKVDIISGKKNNRLNHFFCSMAYRAPEHRSLAGDCTWHCSSSWRRFDWP